MTKIDIYCGDCLEIMKDIPDKSVDLILADLPYGKTKNSWDCVIDLSKLWPLYLKVIKTNGAIILFGQDKFSAKLMLSQESIHRYNLIWDKVMTSGFLNANRMPLRSHEDILVFYQKLPTYNAQKVPGKPSHSKGKMVGRNVSENYANNNYGEFVMVENDDKSNKFPTSILKFQKVHPSVSVHPTQKPVELLEYLIKTYTLEGETVLDNVMGSGSTMVACKNTNRNGIGIEKEQKYFDIAKQRIGV